MAGSALVTHLLHVRLRVPDPEEAAAYYQRALGLAQVDANSSIIRLSLTPRDAVVVSSGDVLLEQGAEAGLAGLGFAVSSVEDLRMVKEALGDAGSNGDGALRTSDPDGCPIEIAVPEPARRRPAVDPTFSFTKLGHVTRRSPNPAAQARWWQETLKFRLSDQIEESFFFLRCNRDHHAVAFVQGSNWGAHHVGLELESWEDHAPRRRTPCRQRYADRVRAGPAWTRQEHLRVLPGPMGDPLGALLRVGADRRRDSPPGALEGWPPRYCQPLGTATPESYFG